MLSRDRVEVWFPIKKDADGYPKSKDWEGLQCETYGEGYRVMSVPFYVKEVGYGDIVCAALSTDNFLQFKCVLSRSGYSVYRLLIRNSAEVDSIVDDLVELNATIERDDCLLAVAVPPGHAQDRVVDFILEGSGSGRWGAQDGYVAED